MRALFDVPQVALRVWGTAPTYAGAAFTMPFCGPNMGFEPGGWLVDPDAAQSLALLTLHDGDNGNPAHAFGMLVLGSPDPLRFEATMGTEFLSRIAALASAALSRMRPAPLTLARA
jgi:uncharacterized protein YigA (DUF484 family)